MIKHRLTGFDFPKVEYVLTFFGFVAALLKISPKGLLVDVSFVSLVDVSLVDVSADRCRRKGVIRQTRLVNLAI